jgi:hypothetical protein
MKNKLKAIWRILFPVKVQRATKLQLAYTFANGRTLYTYGENDFLNISSRYYSAIQTEMVHLEILHQTKHQWKQAIMFGDKACLDIIENAKDSRIVIDIATQLRGLFTNFDLQNKGIVSSSQRIIEMMFCMFFLLDDEAEFGYNEQKNAEKLELINSDPAAKELFFSQVAKILAGHLPISEQTLQGYMVTAEAMKTIYKAQGMNS